MKYRLNVFEVLECPFRGEQYIYAWCKRFNSRWLAERYMRLVSLAAEDVDMVYTYDLKEGM